MGRHARRKPVWRRWYAGGGVFVVAALSGALVLDHLDTAAGDPAPAALSQPAAADELGQTLATGGTVTAGDVDLTAATTAHLRLRPGRATSFRVGLVDHTASKTSSSGLADHDVDVVVTWPPADGDLPTDGWTGYRAAGTGVAWRDDEWRLVHSGTVLCSVPGGTTPVLLVRLANRQSLRWIWVAAVPEGQPGPQVMRELADRLRPQRTPFVIAAATRTRIGGQGFRATTAARTTRTMVVGDILVPGS